MSSVTTASVAASLHAANRINSAYHIQKGAGQAVAQSVLEQRFGPIPGMAQTMYFGRWPEDPDGDMAPIAWQVIGAGPDGALLLTTRDVIDVRAAHDFEGDVTWQQSSLRFWLNKVFFPCVFDEAEQDRVATMELTTPDSETFGSVGCRETYDRVFCLSVSEARRFFPHDAARVAAPTGYARRVAFVPCWWLRSPGGHQFSLSVVNGTGSIDENGFHATLGCVGVRPAIVVAPDAHAALLREWGDLAKFYGRRKMGDLAYALNYADYDEASRLVGAPRRALMGSAALRAVSGGVPSVRLINKLLDQGLFSKRDRLEICLAAVRVHCDRLARRLVTEGWVDKSDLMPVLNACMEIGAVDMVRFLLSQGANGVGYAQAYLPNAATDETAICAVVADPRGALDLWGALRRHPSAVQALVDEVAQGGSGAPNFEELMAGAPNVLAVCARQGDMRTVRYLVEQSEKAGVQIANQKMVESIQEAKAAEKSEIAAYLLDRQAGRFEDAAPSYPVLEL